MGAVGRHPVEEVQVHERVQFFGARSQSALGSEPGTVAARDVVGQFRGPRIYPIELVRLGEPTALIAVQHGQIFNVLQCPYIVRTSQAHRVEDQRVHEEVKPHPADRFHRCGYQPKIQVAVGEVRAGRLGSVHVGGVPRAAGFEEFAEGGKVVGALVGRGEEGAVAVAVLDAGGVTQQHPKRDGGLRMVRVGQGKRQII